MRHQVLEAARFEEGLKNRLRSFREARIDVMLVKGWSIARRYPSKGLRHYSDLDLVVAPGDRRRAEALLETHTVDRLEADLHFAIPYVAGRDLAAMRTRMIDVPLGDELVRTLGDEDHLWLLALHGLGHGLWRSVWLVDLAVLLERATLDWDYLLRGPANDVAAVKVALGLAQRVLDARSPRCDELPAWVEPALLEQWGRGYEGHLPLTDVPRASALLDEARRRWPNAIRATAQLGGPWNEWPRLPLQVLDFGRRVLRFTKSHDDPRGIWAK